MVKFETPPEGDVQRWAGPMDQAANSVMRNRGPESIRLDLFAILHLFYATLFITCPATDLGGLVWFPFIPLAAGCLALSWGIWLRRPWSKVVGIAVLVLLPIIYTISFERELHSGSWAALGYLFYLPIVVAAYVIEVIGVALFIRSRSRIIDVTLSGRFQTRWLDWVVLTGTLALAVFADYVMPRRPNLWSLPLIAIGSVPTIIGLYLLTKTGK